MKKIYLIIGIIISMLLSSCEDFLTTYPQNQLTAGTFFKTDDDFEAAANGMYSVMTGYPSEFFPMIDGITPFAGETATSPLRCIQSIQRTPPDGFFQPGFHPTMLAKYVQRNRMCQQYSH